MDAGTNARDILNGRHEIHLKRDFIGVINRSQKDIDDNKDIRKALSDERRFFMEHPAYGPDMADKMGIRYLQEYLQTELSNHIFKRLPPLKPKIQNKLEELNKKLETIEFPLEDSDKERILAEAYEKMRSSFDAGVGGKAWLVSTEKLNGGTKINSLMNDTYAKEVNKMFYDDNRIRREIGVAIKNAFGTRIGVFVPDTAFISVVANQIELFRKISLDCVDWVTDEIVIIITECVANIESFPKLRFMKYDNNICKPIPDIELKASQQSLSKSDWIAYKKTDFWFVLNDTNLSWYKNETQRDRRGQVDLRGATVRPTNGDLMSSLELVFTSRHDMNKWREWLEEVDVKSLSNSSDNISISNQSSISYTSTTLNKTPQDVSYSFHLGVQVEEVKRLVDAYVVILKKKFKDSLPKLCQLELIDSTSKFIAIDFKVRIRQSYDSTGDIIGDDPDRDVRIDLETQHNHYTEAIDIIDKFSQMKL
ncbi:unnamed protein product [Oppiella nova]|uniref:Uncharacterized protein n=1 Tax=Oppiella nova TaxID=334625 RepID=A0A7R9QW50_9ACAR|nr:unnamed protein product [Oppiella nova]CAG2177248.1 unnamed protein product [Oppiella nova]